MFTELTGAGRTTAPIGGDFNSEQKRYLEGFFDAIDQLMMDARWNAKPEPDSVFRYKWNGLFWLSPVKDGYMCRLRIPGGVVKSFQLRELASVARDLTTGYIQ